MKAFSVDNGRCCFVMKRLLKVLAALLLGLTVSYIVLASRSESISKLKLLESSLLIFNQRQNVETAETEFEYDSNIKSDDSDAVFTLTPTSMAANATARSKVQSQLFVSASHTGRLGNLLFQYATAYGVARLVGKRVYLKSSSELLPLFPALRHSQHVYVSDSDAEVGGRHGIEDPKHCGFAPSVIEQSRGAFNVGMAGYFQSWRYFDEYRDELRAQLQFDEPIRVETDKQMGAVKAKALAALDGVNELTWVAVHIRRGDIVTPHFSSYGYLSATDEYLQRSADYFIDKYGAGNRGLVFLVFSDDFKWSKAHFRPTESKAGVGDSGSSKTPRSHVFVEYVSNDKREVDFSLMTRCNGTIMTVGSFGWWAAYLAGGETFYYAYPYRAGSDLSKQFVMEDYYPPKWHLFF